MGVCPRCLFLVWIPQVPGVSGCGYILDTWVLCMWVLPMVRLVSLWACPWVPGFCVGVRKTRAKAPTGKQSQSKYKQ